MHVHLDEESYRIVASAKIEHYLSKERPEYNQGDEAEVLVWQKTDLGFKVIVDNKYSGMLFHNEIFQPLEPGMRLHAYVKRVREDGKIDLELQKRGVKKVDDFAELLLQYIKDNDGYTPINDKTDAEQIYNTFGVSKKTFKKAVGDLYKKRLIVLEDDGIFYCGPRGGAFLSDTSSNSLLAFQVTVIATEEHAFLGSDRHFLGLIPHFSGVSGKALTDFNRTWVSPET